MGFGVFGKLPQKRDFIAHNLPRSVLEPFEAWLQSAVAASRVELGAGWLDLYLNAPLWRFYFGRDILGVVVAGAVMPSVDAVGRYFPLAILYVAADGEEIAPPPFDAADDWYEAIEARLLGVLATEEKIEPPSIVAGLGAPQRTVLRPEPFPQQLRNGALWRSPGGAAALLGALVPAESWLATSGKTLWWTAAAGGGSAAFVSGALPPPVFFADMIRMRAAPADG